MHALGAAAVRGVAAGLGGTISVIKDENSVVGGARDIFETSQTPT